MCGVTKNLVGLALAATLSTAALAVQPAAADPVPAWTYQLPTTTCDPQAPEFGCLTTQRLDLRRVKYYRLSIQAMNYGLGVPEVASKVQLRDVNFFVPGCFGSGPSGCTVLTIPFSSPPHGPCCMPTFTSAIIPIPVSQRRSNVQLRVEVIGGSFNYNGTGVPPTIQFYTD